MVKEVSNLQEFKKTYEILCVSKSLKLTAIRLYDSFSETFFLGDASRLAVAVAALKQNSEEVP